MSSQTPVANGRADLSPSFEALNEKLWKNTGTVVASMRLELCDETGTYRCGARSLCYNDVLAAGSARPAQLGGDRVVE
jgi:hypothetical protein